MATIRLIPSAYSRSNTNYVTVTNPSNMYNNTDHTSNYCTLRGRAGRSSNSTYYAFINGFNFDDVPENATVTGFKVKIRAYRSQYQATGNTNYRISLASQASNSYKIGNTTLSSDLTTTAAVYEIPTGSLTWDTLKSYGSAFSIDVPLRNSSTSSSNYPYIYVYGAEIEVTYSLPVQHNITITGNNVTPTGTQSVFEGEDLKIRCSDTEKPTVTDNGVDVTSQVVQETESGSSYDVTNISTTYGFAVNGSGYYESNNQGHASSAAVCRIDFDVPVEATITFSVINYAESTYDYGLLSNIDTSLNTNASADSSGVYWNGKNNNSSSVQTITYTMAAGEHYIYAKYFKDNYTDSGNDSFQFKVAITLNEPFTPGTYWVYTLSNVTTDHTVVFSSGSVALPIRVKQNGSWVSATKVFVKQNGSWVQATKVLVKDNGTWK